MSRLSIEIHGNSFFVSPSIIFSVQAIAYHSRAHHGCFATDVLATMYLVGLEAGLCRVRFLPPLQPLRPLHHGGTFGRGKASAHEGPAHEEYEALLLLAPRRPRGARYNWNVLCSAALSHGICFLHSPTASATSGAQAMQRRHDRRQYAHGSLVGDQRLGNATVYPVWLRRLLGLLLTPGGCSWHLTCQPAGGGTAKRHR